MIIVLIAGLFVLIISLVLFQISGSQEPRDESVPSVEWQDLAPLPRAKAGLALVPYLNRIYAVGGDSTDGISADLYIYDPEEDSWISGDRTGIDTSGGISICSDFVWVWDGDVRDWGEVDEEDLPKRE